MKKLTIFAVILWEVVSHKLMLVKGDEDGGECQPSLNNILPGHLNENVKPTHYHLIMSVDMDSSDFGGQIFIALDVNICSTNKTNSQLETQFIFLHAFSKLKIHPRRTKLLNEKGIVPIGFQCRSTPNDFWVTGLDVPLEKGKYLLELEFDGNMDNNVENGLDGLYKGTYFDAFLNREESFAATQFQQIHARMAFPCFDEPQFKSEFTVQIIHQNKYRVLCNMKDLQRIKEAPGWSTTQCDTGEVRMPTYLVAFTLTHAFTASTQTVEGIRYSIWSRQELADSRSYAFESMPKVLKFYKEYTQVPYPMSKIDSIGFPVFAFAGMEHWSLITFNEICLFWREGESTVEAKFDVADTIAHELAHQWFGNRVTVKYWPHFWLNEAFATWLQYKGVEAMEPFWDYGLQQLIDVANLAYPADEMEDANSMFDETAEMHQDLPVDFAILYIKGAAIVTMMEAHVGQDTFQKALRRYMNDFEHGSVVTDDLWRTLQIYVKKFNVAAVYDTWIKQPGFPLITVSRAENHVTLIQKRFFLITSLESDEGPLWPIPVSYYKNGRKKYFLFETRETKIKGIKPETAIKFNGDHMGYYITAYKDWKDVTSLLGSRYLTTRDYAGLLLDIYFLTKSNKLEYDLAFPVVGQILNATDHVVSWRMAQKIIDNVNQFLKTRRSARQGLEAPVNSWLQNRYHSDLWKEAGKTDQQIRFAVTIIELACGFRHSKCLADAKKQLDDLRSESTKKPLPNTRKLIYCFGLKVSNNVSDFDLVWQRYEAVQDSPIVKLKTELRAALSCVKNEDLVNKFLDNIRQEEEDILYEHLNNIANNPDAVEAVWKKFSDDSVFDKLREKLSDEKLGELIVTFARQFSEQAKKEEIEKLIGGRQGFEQSLSNAVAAVDRNFIWLLINERNFVEEE